MGNITYKVVSREIEKEKCVRDSLGGILERRKLYKLYYNLLNFVMEIVGTGTNAGFNSNNTPTNPNYWPFQKNL